MKAPISTERMSWYTDVERCNLEHMLVHPDTITEYRATLGERDFYNPFCRAIYKAVLQCVDAGTPPDDSFIIAVRQRLAPLLPDMPADVQAAQLGALLRP